MSQYWAKFRLFGGCLGTLGSCSKITELAQIFELLFTNVPVMYLF
jgi:hypothetical protein